MGLFFHNIPQFVVLWKVVKPLPGSWLCFDKDQTLFNMMFWFTFQSLYLNIVNCSLTSRQRLDCFSYRTTITGVFQPIEVLKIICKIHKKCLRKMRSLNPFTATFLCPNFNLQKHELCSVTMWTLPLETTCREFSFESWSHLNRFRWTVQDLDIFLVW